jgi:membrane fusion protein (multidrug efflux system)
METAMMKNLLHRIGRHPIPKQLRNTIVGIAITLPLIGGIIGIKIFQFDAMGAAAAGFVMPPSPVNTAEVLEQLWQPRVASVGTVVAVQGTVVSAEADGIVRAIMFEAGSMVKTGDELVRLDTDIEQAQFQEAEANAEWAQVVYTRAKELIGSRSISEAEYLQASVGLKRAQAQLNNIRAVIARKTVRAPFDGKLGIREISVGQFLHKGNPVVSLQSLDPVYVEFSLPQQRLSKLSEGLTVAVSSDTYPGQQFEGEITSFNPDVDTATRNVRVQATLNNPDGRLRPGMFVSVDMLLAETQNVLFIPASAVLHSPFGDSVFVIQEGEKSADGSTPLTAEQQFVRLGARQGDYVVAIEGVKPGEKIVSTGAFKLQPGMPVIIDNALAPEFMFEPVPDNT